MNSKHLVLGFLSIGAAFAWMGSAQAATLTHDYDLKTSLADLNGGASLVAGGGSLSAAGYSFGANQGLTLSNSINPSSYSIFLDFTYTNPNITPSFGPYSKILDFKNRTTDSGFYYKAGALNFYDATKSGSAADIATGITPIAANAPLKLALTRDASGQTAAYLNGVQQFSFADTNGDSIFFPPVSSIINFFNDDAVTSVETSSGLISRISIYDGALSAADASILTGGTGATAVPEPFTVVGTLIGGTAALRMRKKLKATTKV
jgi:hypothetical protein